MDRNARNPDSRTDRNAAASAAETNPVDDRLVDGRDASQEEIVDAARAGFEQDQESPDHPSRVERRAGDVKDPSHSKGSAA